MSIQIIGTGSAVPEKVISNEELATFLDTSDEWISTRTGIKERRVCTTETLMDLIHKSATNALESASLSALDIDLIIVTTINADTITPSAACVLGEKLGADCPMMDLNAACSGFLYALDVAESYILSGKAENILIVCAEEMSKHVDWTDRATAVLFGDGAGAVVVKKGENLKYINILAEGKENIIRIGADKGNSPYNTLSKEKDKLTMEGQEVFRFAVSMIEKEAKKASEKLNISVDEINHFVLHQANMRILESARLKLKQPKEKFPSVIEKYGNCSSASVVMLLDELVREDRIKKGDYVFMSAFGAGLTAGSCIFKW